MKTKILLFVVCVIVLIPPVNMSFAQNSVNCYFGDDSVPIDDVFKKDVAVKAFTEMHPNAMRHAFIDQTEPLQGKVSFTINENNKEEILLIKFNQNENGCYRPYDYAYSYDDGTIDVAAHESLLDITEIINLIKLSDKKIEDFYAKNCNAIQLDAVFDGNPKPHFCKSDVNGSIEMLFQQHVSGSVDIPIKDKILDALFYNCDVYDFIVLNNGEEILYELVAENDKKIFKMDLLPESNKVEIVGFSYGGNDEFCGSILDYDSGYISPRLQTKIGVEPWMVKCNDDLIQIFKSWDLQTPACVFPDSVSKLIERGWQTLEDE